jgi:uncharacterized protein with FMN-binding domain
MRKSIPAGLLAGAVVAIPVGVTIANHATATSTTATTSSAKSTAARVPSLKSTATTTKAPVSKAKPKPITAHRYVGPSEDMQWGPVQVTIVVKGKTVTDISATAPTEWARSAFINGQAVPMLRQEVLQAKTAANIKNIYGISGATMTSEAFYQSLLAALKTAHLT